MINRERIGRRGLLGVGLGFVLAVSAASIDVSAKAADQVGQDPTDDYSDGRGADLASAAGNGPYEPGISFETGAIFKFHKH